MRIKKNNDQLHKEVNALLTSRILMIKKEIEGNKYRIIAKEEWSEVSECYVHSFFIQKKFLGISYITLYDKVITKEIFDNELAVYELFLQNILNESLTLSKNTKIIYERFYEFDLKGKHQQVGFTNENIFFIRTIPTIGIIDTIYFSSKSKKDYNDLEDFIYEIYISKDENIYVEI